MNVDARISVALPSHPKTKKLIKRAGQGAAWNLVCLFLWVSQNKPAGDLTGMSDEDIEIAANWEGEEGGFVKLLSEVRFLDGAQGSYVVHDWEEHNPWAAGAERRTEKSRAAARARWGITEAQPADAERSPEELPEDATGMPAACPPHASGNADSSNGQCPVSVSVSDTQPIPKPKKRAGALVTVSQLVADGLDAQTAEEFLDHRRRKRADLTPRAWEGIKGEAARAGWAVPDAVRKALSRGWQSFDADFVAKMPPSNGHAVGGLNPTPADVARIQAEMAAEDAERAARREQH